MLHMPDIATNHTGSSLLKGGGFPWSPGPGGDKPPGGFGPVPSSSIDARAASSTPCVADFVFKRPWPGLFTSILHTQGPLHDTSPVHAKPGVPALRKGDGPRAHPSHKTAPANLNCSQFHALCAIAQLMGLLDNLPPDRTPCSEQQGCWPVCALFARLKW